MAQQGPTGAEMALQWYARANLGTLLWRVHGQCSIDMLSQATLSDRNIIIAIKSESWQRSMTCQRAQAR